MIIGNHNTDDQVLIIAEIGNNHEGDFGRAKEMIHAAAESGANVVKFQTFRTEHYVSGDNPERVAMLRSFEFNYDEFAKLKEEADNAGIQFMSTPFDVESARFLDTLVPAFKIASGDNTFYPLLDAIADCAKPVLLSCGLASLEQIAEAATRIRTAWDRHSVSPGLAALHCVTAYPVPPEETNLCQIPAVAHAANGVAGYSDHTMGIEAAVLSVAAGARIVEKHFTLDKELSDFRDHQLSADPKDLARLVDRIRQTEVMLGNNCKELTCSEKGLVEAVRRSMAVTRSIRRGENIAAEDLTWIRPAGGMAPGEESNVIGRKAAKDLEAFTIIRPEDLE